MQGIRAAAGTKTDGNSTPRQQKSKQAPMTPPGMRPSIIVPSRVEGCDLDSPASPSSPAAHGESQSFTTKRNRFPIDNSVERMCSSMPVSPCTPDWPPETLRVRRPRFKSADHPEHDCQFGASFAITLSPVNSRHHLEITTTWKSKKTTYTIEIRRLFYLMLVGMLVLPVSSLKISPTAQAIVRNGHAPAFRKVQATIEHCDLLDTGANVAGALADGRHSEAVVDPLLDELSSMVVKEGLRAGAMAVDDGVVTGLVSQITSLVKEGDISISALRTTAARACFSVVAHKLASAALTSALSSDFTACLAHAAHLHV